METVSTMWIHQTIRSTS